MNLEEISKSSDPEFVEILEKAIERKELTIEEGERLLRSKGSEIENLIEVADKIRREEVGDIVTYVVNRNINFTNICINSCKFCAFHKPSDSPGSFLLSKKEVAKKTQEAVKKGATEICFQGGLNPALTFDDYLEYIRAIRSISDEIHIHSYSPAEIDFMKRDTDLSLEETIEKLKEAGLDSVPGTAAEILVDRVRKIICPNKISVEKWEKIIKTLHKLDVPTTATIMYGQVETPREIASHLAKIREIQKETNGFTELVPLPFASQNTELQKERLVKSLSERDHFVIHAVARLMLNPHIKNIQTSWVKLSPKLAQKTLNAGSNDFSGTLIEENITKAAGGKYQELKSEEIRNLIKEAGRIPKQRTTTYELVVDS
ncbi:hypothetical protein AKJ37_07080 [candidate division MSBL1 archaeon SCGC-AAA259I09]|uniref:5-amino-6-(D-ribitylamino)uracil--L-tyrosine 4-hydroxyphenyl transferase n=1 Tax=candidate division MSBL1 archaeon SCGC-AAA259I09 TaxID=1698267 RepID=A0A133ULM9_9EURY|nr:hypothetical protein AKJ37_07080 [candidate division MSBL1 archaeon SCGC-AAA259I09]